MDDELFGGEDTYGIHGANAISSPVQPPAGGGGGASAGRVTIDKRSNKEITGRILILRLIIPFISRLMWSGKFGMKSDCNKRLRAKNGGKGRKMVG